MVMQIPLPVPFPLARGSLARERSPLLELLGGLLVKPPSEVSRSPGRWRPFRRLFGANCREYQFKGRKVSAWTKNVRADFISSTMAIHSTSVGHSSLGRPITVADYE
ncbi:hypothetical protein DAPPUDRAFT_260514 [Daphnia pulex]|uniref:Uncharacterized protein n=1 Tax=Daphnia pulex TaxID=6669 RepID=E9HJC4_DAPPU|nr:hypothetical protein DAPPUDRAFT_260514 [Daphnia pulex]|eukprot:EFX68169.1 hypothetical protein DAPPUDRAFT_260514 [Daphnia pulex]